MSARKISTSQKDVVSRREQARQSHSGAHSRESALIQQGASPLRSGYEEERDAARWSPSQSGTTRRDCVSLHDEAEEWFGKYTEYKGTKITCLLRRHFQLSNTAGYHLVQDKITFLWDVERPGVS